MGAQNYFSESVYVAQLFSALGRQGVEFAHGLSECELESLQQILGCCFPPDLATFLKHALPSGGRFPDWRGSIEEIRGQMTGPLEGILFDVEFNDFWAPSWGNRPELLQDALATARRLEAAAPKLIPIYAHRYIPSEPESWGNPVFSVHQTDIIYYGIDLPNYFHSEFRAPLPSEWKQHDTREIRFWDEIVALNNQSI